MKKVKILLAGRLDLGPLGRHMLSFIETLSQNPKYEVYIDLYYINLYKCDSLSTNKLLEDYTKIHNIFVANKDYEYDFGIFTDLLTLSYDDKIYETFLKRKCTVRICYEVYDGSLPPLDWIDIINDNFDICLSPSIYISQSLHKAGVKVPCFNLPCTVFNEDLLNKKVNINTKKCRFGFIGGAEQRKNLIKTIKAFHIAFKGNPDVELYIHSSYSAEPEYLKKTKKIIKDYSSEGTNIVFKYNNHLEKDEMYELISTFNFYIYPSKTTGYFTTPAEALSLGIPVIVTDIPVHQELLQDLKEDDGIFKIKANIPQPIKHSYLGEKYLGVQYDCAVEEVTKQLGLAYKKVDKLFTKDLIKKRKERGEMYSLNSVLPFYHSLISPLEFISSKNPFIDKNGVFYCEDFNLLQKYKSIYPDLNFSYKKTKKVINNVNHLHIADEHNTAIIEDLCKEIELYRSNVFFNSNSSLKKKEKYLKKIARATDKYNVYYIIRILYYILKIYCLFKRILSLPKRKLKRLKQWSKKIIKK
jgi:glycosyltransferase involved in cell wall biosynthesis